MNAKKVYKPQPEEIPQYLHEVEVNGRSLVKGQRVSVERGLNRRAGQYIFEYGEVTKQGVLLMYAEGPLSRTKRSRVTLRADDIKTVHRRSKED